MVDAAVSFTIEKLSEFITHQVNIRIGVKDGIEWLKDELGYLLISVRAAEAHQELDHVRRWTDSVKEVANEAVIILERFSAQQEEHASHEQGGVLDRMRNFICICKKEANLFDIGKDIESLKERVLRLKSRRDEYRINDIVISPPTVQQRKRTLLRAASFDHQKDVVGFEDDVHTLLAQLGNGDPALRLISIHGMGGLGKSTLASKLYHSSELGHFKRRAWVCVSEDYDIINVLRKLLKCFGEDEQVFLTNMNEVELRQHLRKIMLNMDHYLVVIDDIWDVEVWEKIKNAFPDKQDGSRVIITTRNKTVDEGVDDTCFVHELRFLREDESWQLFCKRAKPTPNLEVLGKEMVGKCGGLPLAIVILSGVLLHKRTYTFWSDVKDHLWRKLKGNSEIQEILNLSYDELSSQMRQCFLYVARFPEDHIFEVHNLKLLWIAEEFVSEADEEHGVDMEDVAEDYLNELINRNLFHIEVLTAERQAWGCRVHDLVRDLAIQKAMDHRVLGIFDSSKSHPNPLRLLQGQTRHAIYNGIGEYLNFLGPNTDDLNLRSLALINETHTLELEQMKMMYTRFKYLKVLDLTSVQDSEGIQEEIGDLILLKFLGLMGGNGDDLVIPSSIGKLKKLQTLIGSESTKYEFPGEICDLKELRHLIFNKHSRSLYIRNHQKKLQTLCSISYDNWFQIDTVTLTNLHTLCITESRVGDDFNEMDMEEYSYSLESIANLTSLQTLVLNLFFRISTLQPLSSCKHLKSVMVRSIIEDAAELRFLPDSVTDLALSFSCFEQDLMPTLGSMPNLTMLSLGMSTYGGDKMVCSKGAFPCLQLFYLNDGNMHMQGELQVDDGALPSLKCFMIEGREGPKVPEGILSLPPPEASLLESWVLRSASSPHPHWHC